MVLTGTAIWTGGKCDSCGEICPKHQPTCPERAFLVGDPGRLFKYDLPKDAVVYKAKVKHG